MPCVYKRDPHMGSLTGMPDRDITDIALISGAPPKARLAPAVKERCEQISNLEREGC
ncbi:hypothetical protein [Photorhabdus aegyptia]|uniref:hypothetical protein n=1 Tax=Photorhabdus aegyptia TaxID=2805098 RepID=UPI001E64D201|nr:hypothetical protein [Photorhabdus aegyptia]MCC8458282.1 hypothetical protein [Photorhabdus aegyptia]